jgi:hypothetical protein
MSDNDAMRDVVIGVLHSSACLNIQFGLKGSYIMPYGYGYVADALAQGAVQIGLADLGNGRNGDYTPGMLRFRRDALSNATSADVRATIVHEATHAVFDGTCPGKTIARADNEFAAYLAESIYRINAGDPVPGGAYVGAQFDTLARKVIVCTADGVYDLLPYDYEDLEPLVMQAYQAEAAANGQTVRDSDVMQGFKSPMVPD